MLAVIGEFNVFGRCFPFLFLLFAFILQENKHSDHIISHHHKQWRWCTDWKNFLSIYRSQDSMSRYHFICVCFVRVRFIYQWSVEMAPIRRSKSFNLCCQLLLFVEIGKCSTVWKLVFYVFVCGKTCSVLMQFLWVCLLTSIRKLMANRVIKVSNISVVFSISQKVKIVKNNNNVCLLAFEWVY